MQSSPRQTTRTRSNGIQNNNYYHIKGVDLYSNVLYVKEHFAALSHLAHRVAAGGGRFRPEGCCAIGNYHSLKVWRCRWRLSVFCSSWRLGVEDWGQLGAAWRAAF